MDSFDNFRRIIKRLRAEDGCPWDREQTHGSLKAPVIEEAAEVISGINIYDETGNPENLKEELGDLLLLIVMQAQIAEEEGIFTMDDVISGITEKMIRRHPHVFGDTITGKRSKSWRRQERKMTGLIWQALLMRQGI